MNLKYLKLYFTPPQYLLSFFYQLIGLLGLGGSGTLIARGSSEFMIINTILAAESLILLIMSVFLLIGTWKVHLSILLLFWVVQCFVLG